MGGTSPRSRRTPLVLGCLVIVAILVPAQGAAAAPVGQITEFGAPAGISQSGSMIGIVAGPDGNLWFTANGPGRIGRITPSGTATEFTAGLNAGSNPQDIVVAPDGNLWFIDNGSTKAIGRITPSGTITEITNGIPSDVNLGGIAVGSDGNLWFTDNGDSPALMRMQPNGTVDSFSAGLNSGSLPFQIAPGPDGNLWFTDAGALSTGVNAIGRINPATQQITEFTTGLNASAAPLGIAPGPDGNMWFTDNGVTKAVGRITPTGTITEFPTGASTAPNRIAPGADGNLWFTDVFNPSDAISRITTAGTITRFTAGMQPAGNSFPSQIAPGPDGNLWFADSGVIRAVGRMGAGAQAASLRPPSVTGSGEQGTQQVCQGDRWAVWAGQQPSQNSPTASSPGVQWLRDGVPLAGQTGHTYVPVAGDVGHTVSCRVNATYELLRVPISATSAAVTVIPQATGPTGPTGPGGPAGPAGPRGPAGRNAKVTCTVVKRVRRITVTCKVKLVARRNARLSWKLMRGGHAYAHGTAVARRGRATIALPNLARLERGRYHLRIAGRGQPTTIVVR